MFGAIAGVVGKAYSIGKGLWHIRGLIREVQDVITLGQKLWSKYDDLDDDAKAIAKELNDVVVKVKQMIGV